MEFRALASHRIIFAIRLGHDRRKIFQAMFLRDGSVVVNFPYFRDSTGLLTQPNLPPGGPVIDHLTIGKNDGSKCTSHRVKYTHHLDGEAHFSQDGKIYTAIRRKAVPLRQANGHLFTLRAQGLDNFKALSEKNHEKSKHRFTVEFKTPDNFSGSIQFTGWIYRIKDLKMAQVNPSGVVGPSVFVKHPQHGPLPAVAIGDPRNPNEETVLVVSLHQTGPLFRNQETGLIFIGGFDPPTIVNDYSLPMGFLSLICPIQDLEVARSEIGTVDLPQ